MSLGSFSRLLSQAASMLVAGRPPPSLHTIRGVGGAVVAAALTGGVGILIFKKRPDDDDGDVTVEDMKDVDNKPRQEDIKKDMGKKHQQMDVDVDAKFHVLPLLMKMQEEVLMEKAKRNAVNCSNKAVMQLATSMSSHD